MDEYPIEINGLLKKFGNLAAVNEISFHLNAGEIFGLLGPNGAGKTTTISILSSLEKATSGSVKIFGKELEQYPIESKKKMGIVPQELLSNGFFTVGEVLEIQSGFFGIRNNKSWIEFVMESLELSPYTNRMANTLSGGLKRRLLIAKALVHKPKLLLLDEPTAGVDVDLRQKLWDLIFKFNKEGMTILLTTHYLEEAEKLCDRIAIIHHGKILKIEETKKMIEKYTNRRITFYFHQEIPKISSPYMIKQEKQKVSLQVPRAVNLSDIMEQSKIDWRLLKDIKICEGSLEEAFYEIIRSANAVE